MGEAFMARFLWRALCLALLVTSGRAWADAVIVKLEGLATAWAGSDTPRQLRAGDTVRSGETVATLGAKSSLTLRFDDGTIAVLHANSRIEVKGSCAPGDPSCASKSIVDLQMGAGRFRSKAPGLKAKAPTGLEAIRANKCTPDAERFRDVDPGAFADQTTQLVWAKCPYGQDFDPGSRQCKGSIAVMQSLDVALAVAAKQARDSGAPWRLPTIEEIGALAAATCDERYFGTTPLSNYGGAPVWTGSVAGEGKVHQFEPSKGGRTTEAQDDAPGIVILVADR